jgi:hypothetical protein
VPGGLLAEVPYALGDALGALAQPVAELGQFGRLTGLGFRRARHPAGQPSRFGPSSGAVGAVGRSSAMR